MKKETKQGKKIGAPFNNTNAKKENPLISFRVFISNKDLSEIKEKAKEKGCSASKYIYLATKKELKK